MLAFPLFVCFVLGGCASQNSYTSELLRQQNGQNIPDGQQPGQEITVTIQKLITQNQLLTEENSRLKREKEDAEMAALVANKKEDLLPQLTEMFQTNAPSGLMNIFGFQGTVLEYAVVDIAYKTNTLFLTQELMWKMRDGNGEIAVINTGLDMDSGSVVFLDLQQTIPVTAEELAKALADTSGTEQELAKNKGNTPPHDNKDIDLKPNNETVNHAYQTGIKVAGAGLILWLTHLAAEGN